MLTIYQTQLFHCQKTTSNSIIPFLFPLYISHCSSSVTGNARARRRRRAMGMEEQPAAEETGPATAAEKAAGLRKVLRLCGGGHRGSRLPIPPPASRHGRLARPRRRHHCSAHRALEKVQGRRQSNSGSLRFRRYLSGLSKNSAFCSNTHKRCIRLRSFV